MRDKYRTATVGALGIAAFLEVTGFVLYAFETPAIPMLVANERGTAKHVGPSDERLLDVAALPDVGAGYYGVRLWGRF